MRLLTYDLDGKLRLTRDLADNAIPSYAILSHTWGADEEEVTLHELQSTMGKAKLGYAKVDFCKQQAQKDGLQHFWIDTCCIDKANHVELSEAITSMFRWYQNAVKCYVYLSDVLTYDDTNSELLQEWESSFCNSKWFTRGWTLQELLAPQHVEFFANNGSYLGDKKTLERLIYKATGIPVLALRGTSLSDFSVEERLSWATRRRTTRKEDAAYCLQGIFGVFIPVMYGERDHAFDRLRAAIEERQPSKRRRSGSFEDLVSSKRHQKLSVGSDLQSKQDNLILQSFSFPEMCYRRLNVESRHEHTCEWILDLQMYKRWTSVSQGLLWIKGKPGAGKSTLMAFLYNELKDKVERSTEENSEIRLDFFLSARGAELQRTFQGMLRALLHQILSQCPSACQLVRNTFNEKNRSFGSELNNWEWQLSELESLFMEVVLVAAQRRPVIVFIDALDEAGEQSARQMVKYFHRLNEQAVSLQVMIKVYISCRHYPITTSKKTEYEVVVENHNGDDIATFVHDTLHLDQVLRDTITENAAWHVLKAALIERAQGVFQWAHLVVPLVQKQIDKGESPQSIHKKLWNVPVELSDVYTHIIENIIDEEDRASSFWIFQWACLAARPLTVDEMRHTLALKGDDLVASNERMYNRVMSLSGGLLEIVYGNYDTSKFVQVTHQSVNDFMLTKGLALSAFLCSDVRTRSSAFAVNGEITDFLSQCHSRLYWTCLNYLLSYDIQSDIPLSRVREPKEYISKAKLNQTLPLANYATTNVFFHAEKAGTRRTRDLNDEISTLRKLIPQWIGVYHILGATTTFDRFPVIGTQLLHIASYTNMTDIIEYLLRDGTNVNVCDTDGRSPLYLAALRNHHSSVNLLIRAGADIDTIAKNGRTPLVGAVGRQHVSMVKHLLRHGANLTSTNTKDGPLHAAAKNGQVELARLLIDAGAPINEQSGSHGTALQIACYNGHRQIVQMLLEAGADVSAKRGHHGSTLQAASYMGHVEIVRILLDAGADVNVAGFEDGHALDDAACSGREAIVQMLLDAGADVNAQGGYYGTALQGASKGGHATVVQKLIDAGADVNASAGHHQYALHAASYMGHVEVVRILLKAGADVNARGGHFGTAFRAATEGLNARGENFSTTFRPASKGDRSQILQILLDAGAESSMVMSNPALSKPTG